MMGLGYGREIIESIGCSYDLDRRIDKPSDLRLASVFVCYHLRLLYGINDVIRTSQRLESWIFWLELLASLIQIAKTQLYARRFRIKSLERIRF